MTAKACEEARAQIKKWMDLVHAGDVDGVVALYAKDAFFHPTLGLRPTSDDTFIRDYHGGTDTFKGFTARKPKGTIIGDIHQRSSPDRSIVVSSGFYDFDVDGQTLHVRFSFVHEMIDGERLITMHHSSLVPF